MGKVANIRDSLVNLVASLNTSRDKQTGAYYVVPVITDEQLLSAYRSSWMARKIVAIPAEDATRKWREWQAEADQIEALEALEKKLRLQGKTQEAIKQARLLGGAALYFSVRGDDPETPLDASTVKKGALEFVTVLPRRVLIPGELENDPLEPGYGKPKYYEVNATTGAQRIDPSRLVIFIGAELPDPELTVSQQQGWGDSVLVAAHDAVRNAESTCANIASLVYEAKVDILKIPGLTDAMADQATRGLLVDRVELCAQLKGNNGMLLMDAEEDYDSKSYNFAGLPDIERQALQVVSGAADIPITRFLGQTPSGLASTGESDLKNYYDSVASVQALEISPAMSVLDEVVIRSALGDRPDDLWYQWASLWQTSDEERSKISKETAETIKILADTRLFPDDALAEAAANMLIEHSIMPSLDITQVDREQEQEEAERAAPGAAEDSSTPRTLYVHRKVANAADIVAWARSQGIKQTLPAAEMHVTIAFSRSPVDWTDIGQDWGGDERGRLHIRPGGARVIEALGDEGAKVLMFNSDDLDWRHRQIREAGASRDWDEYQPHITITYGDLPEDVEPYSGPIVLGPEIFAELDEDWKDRIEEVAT